MDEDDRQSRRGGPTFDPPVYKQRYDFVENIVREFGAKKVHINIPNISIIMYIAATYNGMKCSYYHFSS